MRKWVKISNDMYSISSIFSPHYDCVCFKLKNCNKYSYSIFVRGSNVPLKVCIVKKSMQSIKKIALEELLILINKV